MEVKRCVRYEVTLSIGDLRGLVGDDPPGLVSVRDQLRAKGVDHIPPGAHCDYIENRGDGPPELRFTWDE